MLRYTSKVFLSGCLATLVFNVSHALGDPPARDLNGMPLVFFDDFETGGADRWEQSDPAAWKIVEQGPNRVYQQYRQSQVQTPVRSPFNRALVKDLVVGDLILDVKLQSTIKDYDHRDMCLFFGFALHLRYVHLGKKTDDHANQIFIVNDEPHKKISRRRRREPAGPMTASRRQS